jgi:polar amino acid transport system substrate-binding protein
VEGDSPTVSAPDKILDEALEAEGITPQHREDIKVYLQILKNRDPKTYEHSIRVGLSSAKIALYAAIPGISARMMLWAGLLHDIGKALIPSSVLTKTSNFTEEDFATMEPHVKYGWDMLNQVHDWTAHIIVRHHQFGPHPYPAELPPLPEYLKSKADMIQKAARLLAMADFYDALMNRNNDKNGQKPLTPKEKREIYMRDNADQKELAELLESVGVLKF